MPEKNDSGSIVEKLTFGTSTDSVVQIVLKRKIEEDGFIGIAVRNCSYEQRGMVYSFFNCVIDCLSQQGGFNSVYIAPPFVLIPKKLYAFFKYHISEHPNDYFLILDPDDRLGFLDDEAIYCMDLENFKIEKS